MTTTAKPSEAGTDQHNKVNGGVASEHELASAAPQPTTRPIADKYKIDDFARDRHRRVLATVRAEPSSFRVHIFTLVRSPEVVQSGWTPTRIT
jgi:hypothetical protein